MIKNKQFASIEELMPLMKESFEIGQKVKFSPRGKSMLPLLREGKDSVTLSKAETSLKAYDIALYQRADGKYILHRIVAVDGRGNCVCMGDNQLAKEFGITRDQVIAVVTGISRDGRELNLDSTAYRLYCHVWYQGRRGLRLLHRIFGRLRRK